MKIIEHTSNTLIIRDCAGRILVAGLCIIAIAGAAFAGLADSYTSNENKANEYVSAVVLLFSLIGLAVGGCIIYEHPLVYTKFNKNLNEASVHWVGILKNEKTLYRLDEIEDIVITKTEGSEDSRFYTVALKLIDNSKIPISSSCWLDDVSLKESAEAIKEFLNTKTWQFTHSRTYELMRVSCRAT